MNCPKCTGTLEALRAAVRVAGIKVPMRCGGCGGLWVSRSSVPALQASGVLEDVDTTTRADREADKRNGLCPEGHGIMARARVSWEEPYFVERCPHCDGVWLDAGEWSRLSSEHLLSHLDELWLPSWRRRIQDEFGRTRLEEDLQEKLGPELFERAQRFGMELAAHAHGDVALAYIRELVRRHRARVKAEADRKVQI